MSPATRPRGLDLPEADEISSLLQGVLEPVRSRAAGSGRFGKGDRPPSVEELLLEAPPRPRPVMPAAEFFRAVNWSDDPAKMSALHGKAGEAWEVARYLQQFNWD